MSKAISLRQNLIFSILYTLIIIAICLIYDINFFSIDDATNEFIGYYTQVGKILCSGSFPFIIDNIFLGGNTLVELSHSFFTPQAIIACILSWLCNYKQITGIFLAIFNIFLICFSCVYIAKYFKLKKIFIYGFCSYCVIQPIFLLIYCRSWWIAANGHAWAFAVLATFLMFYKNVNVKNFLMFYISLISLLLSYWIFSILFAFICISTILLNDYKKFFSCRILLIISISILSILFAIPFYSEYLYNSDLHTRFNIIFNDNNLVPSLSSFFTNFIPTYYDFIIWFGNYTLIFIPLAFSTIFLPASLIKKDIISIYNNNNKFKLLIIIFLAFALLSQLPTPFFSIRWPFRMLPYTSFILCLICFLILSKSKDASINVKYLTYITIFTTLLTMERVAGYGAQYIYLQLSSFVILIALYFIYNRFCRNTIFVSFTALTSLLIILFGVIISGDNYICKPPLINKIKLPDDYNSDGFSLRLGPIYNDGASEFMYYSFSRGGIHDIKTINGYTPLGYKNLYSFLPGDWSHFETKPALDNFLVKIPNTDMCLGNKWRISTFVLPESDSKDYVYKLESCGYHLGKDKSHNGFIYASLHKQDTVDWKNLPPTAYPNLNGIRQLNHTNNSDTVYIPEHDYPITLIFPRLYWHGYQAYLENHSVQVSPEEDGFLTMVSIPAGESGELKLSFFPTTWRYLLWLPLVSIISVILLSIWISKRHIN